jgi:ABC-type branched-subunit amino acid transport system ATPase component
VPKGLLVGTTELAALLRLVDDARAGRGGLVVLTGEAGIGKTRVLQVLADEATRGGSTLLSGTAVQDSPAYRPVSRALLPLLRGGVPLDLPELSPYRAAGRHRAPAARRL